MRFWKYVGVVDIATVLGMVLFGATRYATQGGDFVQGLSGGVVGLIWGAQLSVPLGVLWVAIFAGTFYFLRRRAWLAGGLAGLLAGAAVGLVLISFVDSANFSIIGTLEEQRAYASGERLALIPPVIWSGVAGAIFVPLGPRAGRFAVSAHE